MDKTKVLEVKYGNHHVGTLALYEKFICAFEYSDEWLVNGFSLNPYSLPLRKKVYIPKIDPFEGLFGVFADSLPDGWGRLLVDRLLKKQGTLIRNITQMDRLAIVGNSGMGALSYEPELNINQDNNSPKTLDDLAKECEKILTTEYDEDLDNLFRLGGSSGGARPKILTEINNENWIIKFPFTYDSKDIGMMEYEYSLCAKECGINMEETKLFPSSTSSGYFGTRRFDRTLTKNRIHMVSVSAMLETSHRIPNLDYDILFKLTLDLTKDFSELLKLYRLMCFNVIAHNRDDHSKNFSYLYDENSGWTLAPAYDLTYSSSLGGEHATSIDGNGVNPGLKEVVRLAKRYGIKEKDAKKIWFEIKELVEIRLARWH